MKFVKKNQIIIYVIALMLVTAGYLNYVSSGDLKSVSSSMSEEELVEMANIGDAQLVSNNDSNIVNDVDNSSNTDSNLVEKTNSIDNNMTEQTSSLVTNTDNKTNSDYFTSSKLERDSMYSQMIETYEGVLNSSNASEMQKQSATDEIKKINDIINSIMIAENLIKTKGFDDCIIFVNGNSVSIIVKDDELNQEQIAQIQNIVARELSVGVESIHISSKVTN